MLKKTLSMFCLSLSLYASSTNISLNAAKQWQNGFITAFKAMQVETKLQGINNHIIPTKKYIIYFNANKNKVSVWDSLMVQMFGYTSSIFKPVRTTTGWLIFGSFNGKATAYQELNMLNAKMFKNAKGHELKIFINKNHQKFYADKALLSSEIEGLEHTLKQNNKKVLAREKQSLRNNQKIAIVYVNKKTGTILKTYHAKKPMCNKHTKFQKKNIHRSIEKGKLLTIYTPTANLYYTMSKKEYFATLKKGNEVKIVKKIGKWGVTSLNHYILLKSFQKPKSQSKPKQNMSSKPKKPKQNFSPKLKTKTQSIKKSLSSKHIKPKDLNKSTSAALVSKSQVFKLQNKSVSPVEKITNYVLALNKNYVVYKIQYWKKAEKIVVPYDVVAVRTIKNNYSPIPVSYKVKTVNNALYFKVFKKDYFLKKTKNLRIIK